MSDWIEWSGGSCPIPDAKAKTFSLQYRGGFKIHYVNADAKKLPWSHEGKNDDITHYRLIEPKQPDLDRLECETNKLIDKLAYRYMTSYQEGKLDAYNNILDLISRIKSIKEGEG